MFSIKELNQLRTIPDNEDGETIGKLDENHANKIIIQSLRSKISDLITLQKVWNKGKNIQIEEYESDKIEEDN